MISERTLPCRATTPRRIVPLLLCALLLAGAAGQAHAQSEPDDYPVVELYTIGQGVILFEKFGHAVLCLRYPNAPRRDVCFNYGTADFRNPIKLGWGFFRGKEVFWVGMTSPSALLRFYKREDRTIWLQTLDLKPQEIERILELLEHDNREENREFRYEFFTENCTTKLRDILDDATGGKLSKNSDKPADTSYREMARIGLAEDTLVLISSDFVLSRSADTTISEWARMFHPDFLRAAVETRFGAKPVLVHKREGRDISQDQGLGGRGWVVLGILLLCVPALVTRMIGSKHERLALGISMVPLMFFTIAVWGVAIMAPMPELRINEALLVFFPGDLVLLWATSWRRRYAQVRLMMILATSLLLVVGVFTQPLYVPMLVPLFPLLAASLPDRSSAGS